MKTATPNQTSASENFDIEDLDIGEKTVYSVPAHNGSWHPFTRKGTGNVKLRFNKGDDHTGCVASTHYVNSGQR